MIGDGMNDRSPLPWGAYVVIFIVFFLEDRRESVRISRSPSQYQRHFRPEGGPSQDSKNVETLYEDRGI